MADARAAPDLPEGRYGRRGTGGAGDSDARTDRRLKIVGAVFGAVLLAVVGWLGVRYVAGQDVSGELIKFKVVSDQAVEAHLEIRKDADASGVCTLRALGENKDEVGRKDVPVDGGKTRIDTVVTTRTTARATAVELVGCSSTHGH